jgi:hypothetical protein
LFFLYGATAAAAARFSRELRSGSQSLTLEGNGDPVLITNTTRLH